MMLIINVVCIGIPNNANPNINNRKQVTAPGIMVYILEYNNHQYYLLLI